jgi:anti-sigma factor RsiW
MDGHDQLARFLAGELGLAAAREWDEHLLECEQCWRAVREDRAGRQAAGLLREPAPAGLADRVRFAVELAAAATIQAPRPRPRVWLRQGVLAAVGALALAAAAALAVLDLPGGRAGMPAPVAAVARYAEALPHPVHQPKPSEGGQAAVELGRPVTLAAGGQRIIVRTWRLGGIEVVVATSGRPFPMPRGAQGTPSGGMAWSARAGRLSMYCINGRASELVAAPVPVADLAALTARLPLA